MSIKNLCIIVLCNLQLKLDITLHLSTLRRAIRTYDQIKGKMRCMTNNNLIHKEFTIDKKSEILQNPFSETRILWEGVI